MLSVPVNSSQPAQNTFRFPGGIEVSSEFDSGNLSKCYTADDDPKYFNCWMSGDGMPYSSFGHYRTWFYFSIKGVQKDDTLTFAIKGMASQGKLYKMGLRPVYRVSPNSMKWKRCSGMLKWDV